MNSENKISWFTIRSVPGFFSKRMFPGNSIRWRIYWRRFKYFFNEVRFYVIILETSNDGIFNFLKIIMKNYVTTWLIELSVTLRGNNDQLIIIRTIHTLYFTSLLL